VGGVGRMRDDVIAGHGVGGVEGQGMDDAVIDPGVWGVRGRAVQRAVKLGDGQLCIRRCARGPRSSGQRAVLGGGGRLGFGWL
jgi:hypothetical protein